MLTGIAAHLKSQVVQVKDKDSSLTKEEVRGLDVAELSLEVLGHVKDVQATAKAANQATKHADETHQHAVDAKSAIARGSTSGSRDAMGKLARAREACEQDLETAIQKRKGVHVRVHLLMAGILESACTSEQLESLKLIQEGIDGTVALHITG